MAHFSLGLDTHKVPMSLHAENRARLIDALGEKARQAGAFVLLEGGVEEPSYDTDRTPVFRQESFFQWAFGVSESGAYGAIDLCNKKSILFIPRLPEEYIIWMGKIQPPQFFKDKYEVDCVCYTDEVAAVLTARGASLLYTMAGQNSDSKRFFKPPHFEGMGAFQVDQAVLFPIITECRVFKTDAELEVLRATNRVSSAAHEEVMRRCRPGMMEYQLESIFRHHCYYHGGHRHVAYTCICASESNAATLHYGHAGAPNDRHMRDGDMVLLDMGGEYHCYASDITRSYPVNGRFTPQQKAIYNIVEEMQDAVFGQLREGVLWTDMHLLALRVLCAGLLRLGVLRGTVEELMGAHVGALFMPHGLGHFMGLDVHDCGGYNVGCPARVMLPGIKNLRTAREMKERMVVTVEPGCYFIWEVLQKAIADKDGQGRFLVEEELVKYKDFGGVRIEDDVIVWKDRCENMTTCPRAVDAIEMIMAGQ
mmetsp:Transcript_49832/g.125276  ORF Transcript_49832/g.125276 Transcript_49832/m.125276 type:complete len:479 (-) Transcript_49832:107-1543(-)|eukprot:CAMPEP_0177641406 /NCGR_PEP_ID=MMETSP0447-20121125/7047_1 /TAXON_ID=0 /ORGANISM="Stygamoeba regulata, Strain BSH-02190019" /LENGTH=478 /DNA_ID=CAMNT_0019143517 /DNA_START=26 /DNA_END=1462 /DNA_ORIENTATION=+